MNIPITHIQPPKMVLRPVLRKSVAYHELMDSIREDGLLQPILVRPVAGSYEVVEGNWRYNACRDVGLMEIPCHIRDLTDDQVEVIQLKTQAIRPETTKSHYAKRLRLLMEKNNHTISSLGQLINKDSRWIRSMLSLSTLTPDVQKKVDRGQITLKNSANLVRLPSTIRDNFVAHAIMMSNDDFQELVRRAVQDIRQVSQQNMTAWVAYKDSHYIAQLRQLSEINAEIASNRAALRALRLMEAVTPLDGWRACLAWVFQIDPDSLSRQKTEKEARNRRKRSLQERKKQNTFVLKELRNMEPEIHYE